MKKHSFAMCRVGHATPFYPVKEIQATCKRTQQPPTKLCPFAQG